MFRPHCVNASLFRHDLRIFSLDFLSFRLDFFSCRLGFLLVFIVELDVLGLLCARFVASANITSLIIVLLWLIGNNLRLLGQLGLLFGLTLLLSRLVFLLKVELNNITRNLAYAPVVILKLLDQQAFFVDGRGFVLDKLFGSIAIGKRSKDGAFEVLCLHKTAHDDISHITVRSQKHLNFVQLRLGIKTFLNSKN